MANKEIVAQDAVLWVLGAVLSVGVTVTFIYQDITLRKPACIRESELLRSAVLIDVEHQINVCKD